MEKRLPNTVFSSFWLQIFKKKKNQTNKKKKKTKKKKKKKTKQNKKKKNNNNITFFSISDILSTTTTSAVKDQLQPISFLSLKNRIIDLLRIALTNETDATNTQMLLGGLMLVVQDLAICEESESMTLQPGQDTSDSDNNPGVLYFFKP